MDGKAFRGSTSAWCKGLSRLGIEFANSRARGVRSKNLKNPDKYKDGLDRLDIQNKLVTMEAIPIQVDTGRYLVEGQLVHDIMAVTKNPLWLSEAFRGADWDACSRRMAKADIYHHRLE